MKKKVLVIEDDPSASELMVHTLEPEGYQVITASNGLEGLKKAMDERPDLIILDVMLPGLDGYEVCQRLRRKPEIATLPILMISAKARQDDIDTGINMGGNDYLTKPSKPSEILAKVEALLASKNKVVYVDSS